jgi:hypothetical protein
MKQLLGAALAGLVISTIAIERSPLCWREGGAA